MCKGNYECQHTHKTSNQHKFTSLIQLTQKSE